MLSLKPSKICGQLRISHDISDHTFQSANPAKYLTQKLLIETKQPILFIYLSTFLESLFQILMSSVVKSENFNFLTFFRGAVFRYTPDGIRGRLRA